MKKNKTLSFKTGQKPFVIAEIGQTHDGNINIAHAYIDAVANTGADAVKFQTHIAEEESTPAEKWRIEFSHQDKTRYDYWKRMEFSVEDWHGLKKHADERNLMFLSSPFSIAAIDLLDRIGVPAWKIGSGEVLSKRMLSHAIKTKKPLILSTGMSDMKEIDENVTWLQQQKCELALMQCTTQYPTSYEEIGLNVITELKNRHNLPVGLSDHSGTIWPSLAAASLGAELLEVHAAFSKDCFGPDVSSSITTADLRTLCEGINAIYTMHQNPVDKSKLTPDLEKMRALFMKSIVAREDLKAGTILSEHNITDKKPAEGLSGHVLDICFNMKLTKPLGKDERLTPEHLSQQDQKTLEKHLRKR